MLRKFFLHPFTAPVFAGILFLAFTAVSKPTRVAADDSETPGSLQAIDADGRPKALCPLKHTDVKAEITGFLSRVYVTQEFENPFNEKIEAVYTFPLPQRAAVDDMTMTVGDRVVRGKILRREEAQAVYKAAKTRGQVASLLDQERPNIFTQSVANILPGEKIRISISYVETLNYEDGSYEFVFPMVVGPRYIPGSATGQKAGGFSPDTDSVPDASRITPRPIPEGMRAGHNVSLEVTLDAGLPIDEVKAKSHEVNLRRLNAHSAQIKLKSAATIPNKDFVLKYDVAGKNISDALITHRSSTGGYFTLILQPPERVTARDVTPKELVFVLDTSGSMNGFPIEKAKETMKLALETLYPSDTFNLITFAGDTRILFPQPVPATVANLRRAQSFLASSSGQGGTEMMKAIKASLDPTDAQDHVRIVCFMTDGYVGNDMEIISEIQKHPNARVFAFGIGSSVNRFLLDKMAEQGRGEVEYVGLNDDGSAAAHRFHERVRNPLLTDISIEWGGLPVTDVYPKRVPDLFGAKPVTLTGRFTAAGRGVVRLKGKMAGNDFVREIPVEFPESQPEHNVLSSLWARARIDDLMNGDYHGMQRGEMKPELKEAITNLGLDYRLMTQFTSFVAVEEMIVTDGGQPRRIDVPVEVPEGVNRRTVFDEEQGGGSANKMLFNVAPSAQTVSEAVIVTSGGTAKMKREQRIRSAGAGSGASGGGGGGRGGAGMSRGAKPSAPSSLPEIIAIDGDASRRLKGDVREFKLHPSIRAAIERLKTKDGKSGDDESTFVRDGKAKIQIWLNIKTDEGMAQLKQLGFEVMLEPRSANMVIGRLPIEKLEQLKEFEFIRLVVPYVAKQE